MGEDYIRARPVLSFNFRKLKTIETSMKMQGMGPMFGSVSSIREVFPGVYDFDADFSMVGQWNFLVTFQPNGRAQFNLNAQ